MLGRSFSSILSLPLLSFSSFLFFSWVGGIVEVEVEIVLRPELDN